MTKKQWIIEYRQKRIEEKLRWSRQTIVSSSIFNEVLKELYDYLYLPKEQVAITLVHKYKEKLSAEYLDRHAKLLAEWKPEAKIRVAEMWKSLIYDKNPFLAMIPKENQFAGKYYPVPIKYTPE